MARPARLWKMGRSASGRPQPKAGKKVGVNWDKVQISDNHELNARLNVEDLESLRIRLAKAEREGRYSAATKIRREINEIQENDLVLHSTVCGTCFRPAHTCRCEGLTRQQRYRARKKKEKVLNFLHRVLEDAATS